jgi:hypothetical protein
MGREAVMARNALHNAVQLVEHLVGGCCDPCRFRAEQRSLQLCKQLRGAQAATATDARSSTPHAAASDATTVARTLQRVVDVRR